MVILTHLVPSHPSLTQDIRESWMVQSIAEAGSMCHRPHVWSFVKDPGLSLTTTFPLDFITPAGDLRVLLVSTSWEGEGEMG